MTTEAQTTASPAKLRNGSWGARISGTARTGQRITIRTRGGKEWAAVVSCVVWTGKDRNGTAVTLVETTKATSAARGGYRPRRGVDFCGYPCPVDGHRCTADHPCHDCF